MKDTTYKEYKEAAAANDKFEQEFRTVFDAVQKLRAMTLEGLRSENIIAKKTAAIWKFPIGVLIEALNVIDDMFAQKAKELGIEDKDLKMAKEYREMKEAEETGLLFGGVDTKDLN